MTPTYSPDAAMRRAIALSRKGFPAPNPRVGCVIVRGGRIVGEGYHAHAGGAHAEAMALSAAGESARGADVFVTLEPCKHHGRTPPCTEALLAAGVTSVTAATLDPNPKAGGGLALLSAAGVLTQSGLLEAEAAAVNEQFLVAMRRKRPFVVGKAAMSLDGRVALQSGESKWITGSRARNAGQRLRAECGAVLVGRGTIAKDNPRLTARIPGVVNQPTRVILDPNGGLSGQERVFGPEAPTLHVLRHAHRESHLRPVMNGLDVDLEELLGQLWNWGLTALLVEGGPSTLSRFLRAGLVDRLELFVGSVALGAGASWFIDNPETLESAHGFEILGARKLGPDLQITARPKRRG